MSRRLVIVLLVLAVVGAAAAGGGLLWLRSRPGPEPVPPDSELPRASGHQQQGDFHKVVLVADHEVDGVWTDTLAYPTALAVDSRGRVFFTSLRGPVRMWDPATGRDRVVLDIEVYGDARTQTEEGLLGIALDPRFDETGWVYLHYADPALTRNAAGTQQGVMRISRFDFDGERLVPASEKVLLETTMDREMCCHAGGSLGFGPDGHLYAGIGDNTPPQSGAGYACLDERPGRVLWDSQRTSSDTSDLRGKILRIHPEPDGSYTIPEGNLFPPGTEGARPEIYVMGVRNPWKIGFDRRKGILYWGDPGPDAGDTETRTWIREGVRELLRGRRGPPGHDEINAARAAGNYGWPYFVGPNLPYADWDYETETPGELFDPERVANDSPNNRGLRELPDAQPSLIHYPYAELAEHPELGKDGRVAGVGAVYYFDPALESSCKLPADYDHTLFIFDWMRNWIVALRLDENEQVASMQRFLPEMTFMSPIALDLGPDGCLYVIEWGSYWGAENLDSQISRIEYRGGHR